MEVGDAFRRDVVDAAEDVFRLGCGRWQHGDWDVHVVQGGVARARPAGVEERSAEGRVEGDGF